MRSRFRPWSKTSKNWQVVTGNVIKQWNATPTGAWPLEIKQMKAIVRQQKLITITGVCQQTKIHYSFGRNNNAPFGNCISVNLNIYLI
jgi:hypothetical protein